MLELELLSEARELKDEMIRVRRYLHMHPELSGIEFQTSNYIAQQLTSLGIQPQIICGTAVIGLIQGAHAGQTVALRADIDALPIQELNTELPYCSAQDGIMHACGHDVHMTALLFAAKLLMGHREQIKGNVKLLFQPGEEVGGFAKQMILAGVMDDPPVESVVAFHQSPTGQVGTVSIPDGVISSAGCRFSIQIHGKAAHGACPQDGIDAIAIGCQIVTALHQHASRFHSESGKIVLSIGSFHAGQARNCIAGEATISGIHRTPSLRLREEINTMIRQVSEEICEHYGATVDVSITNGAAPVINSAEHNRILRQTAEKMLGASMVKAQPMLPITIAEDCGEFFSLAKGCYYHIGSGNYAHGISAPIHSADFDIDEDCLPIAAAMQAAAALNLLNQ